MNDFPNMVEAKLALSRGLVRLADAAIADLEAELATQRHIRGVVQERLNKCGFRLAELAAELAAIKAQCCEGCGRYDYCFLWSEPCRPFMTPDFRCNRWVERSAS